MASFGCHILSLQIKCTYLCLKGIEKLYKMDGFPGFPGLIGFIGPGLGRRMGHTQLHTAVASQSLLLPVEPHEAATEAVCPFPPITRIIDSLFKTDIPLDTFDFKKS